MANIQLQQPSGAGNAPVGEALNGGWAAQVVTVHAMPDGAATYSHTLTERPPGSTSTMATPNAQNATFTPTAGIAGVYTVTTVITPTPGTGVPATFTRTVEVTRDAAGVLLDYGLTVPANNEDRTFGIAAATPNGYVSRWEAFRGIVVAQFNTLFRSIASGAFTAITAVAAFTAVTAVRRFARAAVRRLITQTITLQAGTVDGEMKQVRLDGTRLSRTILANPDGSAAYYAGAGKQSVLLLWDNTGQRWNAVGLGGGDQRKVFRLEDYDVAGPVGVGNAAADTAAWLAMKADFEVFETKAIAGASWSGGVATYTFSEPHGVKDGENISVFGVTPSGYNVSTYDGVVATVVNSTTITIPKAVNPGAYVSGGAIDPDISNLELGAIIEFSAPEYKFNIPLQLALRWGWGAVEIRGAGTSYSNAFAGTRLSYVGPPAVLEYGVSVTFNRAARTITRHDGATWASKGWAVGMRPYVFAGAASTNNKIHLEIASFDVGGTVATLRPVTPTAAQPATGFDYSNLRPADEGPVSVDMVQAAAVLELQGPHNIYAHDFTIHNRNNGTGDDLLACGVWLSIIPDKKWRESGSNNFFDTVFVYGSAQSPASAAWWVGTTATSPAVGQQMDTTRWFRCNARPSTNYSPKQRYWKATAASTTITTSTTPGGAAAPHTFVNGEQVLVWHVQELFAVSALSASGKRAPIVEPWKPFYVRDANQAAGTLSLSETRGGAAITFTTTGGNYQLIRGACSSSGWLMLDGNNTKVHAWDLCSVSVARYAWDIAAASENYTITRCQVDTIEGFAVRCNGNLTMHSCQGERVMGLFDGMTFGEIHAVNCNMHGSSHRDDWVAAKSNGKMLFDMCRFFNTRAFFSITAYNTGTDTVTLFADYGGGAAGGEAVLPYEGQMVVMRTISALGRGAFPGSAGAGGFDDLSPMVLKNVAYVSPGVYTAQIAYGSDYTGGTPINITAAGTSCFLLSESVFSAGDTPTSSVRMTGCTLAHSMSLPRITGSSTLVYHHSRLNIDVPRAHVVCSANRSYLQGIYTHLSDLDPATIRNQFNAPFYPQDKVWLTQDRDWQTVEFNFNTLKNGSGSLVHYFVWPTRIGIEDIIAEICPDSGNMVGFAGGGLTSMSVRMGYYTTFDGGASMVDDDLLPRMNLINSVNVTSTSWAASVATINTAAAHNQQVGDWVTIAGVVPVGYNVTAQVASVVDADTFTVAMAVDPGAYTSGGTVAQTRNSFRKGFEGTGRGARLKTAGGDPKKFWPSEPTAYDANWTNPGSFSMVLNFTTTGGSGLAGLTQGCLRIHFRTSIVPRGDQSRP